MTTMNDAEREAFEHCWAVRSADDEGNLGAKPLRSEADPQRYRGSSAQGSWVWFQRGAAWQRAQSAPAGERDSYWFSLLMNCAAELETASYCMTDTEAKRVAQSGADYYRDQARAAWQRAQGAVPDGYSLVPVSSLVKIAAIIDPVPVRMPNGDTMVFKNPHSGPALREISAEFRALLAAAPATPAAQLAVPDVSAMARVLSDRSADACNIDRDDNWAMYGQEYIEDVRAMLAASTGQEVEK